MRFHAPVVLPVSRLAGVTVHAQGMRLACRVGAALWIAGAQLLMAQSLAWSEVERMPRRTGFLACYDSWRERVIVTGGWPQSDPVARVWEWDGTQWAWQRSATGLSPPADIGSSKTLGFDELRGVAVLLAPAQVHGRHDRWEWNGTAWRVIPNQSGPHGGSAWLMSWEPMSGGLLVFGGSQTWCFDGSVWVQLSPDVTPKYSAKQAMTLDPHRRRIVLLSGDETWEWDGLDWHARGPIGVPVPTQPRLVFDDLRGRVLMLVKDSVLSAFRIYSWDGSRWSPVTVSDVPPEFDDHSQVTRSPHGGITAFGGFGAKWSGVWHLGRERWQRLAGPDQSEFDRAPGVSALVPDPARGSLLAYGRGRNTVAFELWEFRQRRWTFLGDGAPGPILHRCAAWDERRNRLVVVYIDTCWEWHRTAGWSKVVRPPLNLQAGGAAFDAARGYTLFACNTVASGAQTFGWDGSTWTQFPNSSTPPNLIGLAHDRPRGETIGITGDALTWRWNGQAWIKLTPRTPPAVWFVQGGVAFDPGRRQIVALNLDRTARLSSWDGTDWSVAPLPPIPHATLHGVGVAWDPSSQRICMTGLCGPNLNQAGTRTYLLTPEPAGVVVVGDPCGGIAPPHLGTFAPPALGERMALELTTTRALAPAAFLLGTASANIRLGPCTLRVDPMQPLVAVPALTDMHGFTRLPLPIPYDLTLRGFTLHTQALLDEPLVPLTRIATSPGLALRIGD